MVRGSARSLPVLPRLTSGPSGHRAASAPSAGASLATGEREPFAAPSRGVALAVALVGEQLSRVALVELQRRETDELRTLERRALEHGTTVGP